MRPYPQNQTKCSLSNKKKENIAGRGSPSANTEIKKKMSSSLLSSTVGNRNKNHRTRQTGGKTPTNPSNHCALYINAI